MVTGPLILAVETSGRTGSVALAAGEQMLAETSFSNPMKHSKEVFPAVSGLLAKFQRKPHEIKQIHISVGPGSFTGLRIAVTIAKILNLAATTKIVAVDTLDVISANVDDYMEEKERTGQERSRKMQALMSEKAEIEELMTSYFPQLDPQYKAGKPTNSQFNQAFYDRATEIWKEQYKSHPLQQLRAALRAAQELNIIPQAISKAKKEGFEAGKKDKKILGPVKSGAQKTGKTGPLSREEYLALSPEKKEEHDAHQVGV